MRWNFVCTQTRHTQVVTDLANAADRAQSNLPDRQSEIRVLRDTLTAKTDQEEKEEKKMLDRDMDDIGEGSARGTVRGIRCLPWGEYRLRKGRFQTFSKHGSSYAKSSRETLGLSCVFALDNNYNLGTTEVLQSCYHHLFAPLDPNFHFA